MRLLRFVPIFALALVALAGCSLPAAVAGGDGPVVFEVTGSTPAQNVTWGVNGNQSQETSVALPFRREVPDPGSFAAASLVAQNGAAGALTCRITRAGKTLAEQTSSGQYAVVTCSGS